MGSFSANPDTKQQTQRRLREAPVPTDSKLRRREGLLAAVLIAVFFHLFFLWATPSGLFTPKGSPVDAKHTLDFVLEPIIEEAADEQRYVQAPRDIPERKPEQTHNFSDRDQVAAQEESAPPSPDNSPMVDGDEADSNRIVQGDPFQDPTPPAPPVQSPSQAELPTPQLEAAPKDPVQIVAVDAVEQDVVEDSGLRSQPITDKADEVPETDLNEAEPSPQQSPFDGRGKEAVTLQEQTPEEAAPTPRPRTRIERDTSFGPLRDNRQGAVQIGRLAFDSVYSEFGDYWRRVAEIIERRWRNLVYNTRAIRFEGHRVAIEFDISRDGSVSGLKVLHSGAGKLAESISTDAIVGEAPFFPWTPEMIVVMGEKTTVRLIFIY